MTTYTLLKQDISKWLQRNDEDVIQQIPTFINNAEFQINRDCKNIGFEKFVISAPLVNGGGFIPNNAVVPKPSGWRNPLGFSCFAANEKVTMQLLDINSLELYWPDDNLTGVPKYYAEYGIDYIKVAPTPDSNYPYKINYLEFPLPLSDANQTNWLTDYIPDILLICSLLNSMPYVKDDNRFPLWQAMYKDRIAALNKQDIDRTLDRGSNRMAD